MTDLTEKIIFPDPDSMGFIRALITFVLSLWMLAGTCAVLFALFFPVVLFVVIVLMMLVDGLFGTHLSEEFNAVISST